MKLTKKELIKYYYKLYKIRETELRIAKEYPNQEMRCPVHLSIGQEAPSAAVNIFLNKNDFAISYHRAHAHYIAKDGGHVPYDSLWHMPTILQKMVT